LHIRESHIVVTPISGGWALFLDLDGTLLDIAPTPEGVRIPESLCRDLENARRAVDGALALVSGRSIATIDRLLAPLRLPAAGQHGAEIRCAPEEPILLCSTIDLGQARRLLTPLTAIAGIVIEDKGASLAVHHRQASTPSEDLYRWIADALAPLGGGLEILRGRRVFDVKPRGISKATAVEQFMARAPFGGRLPVFVGDDKTDEDGFRAVTALGGIAIQVGPNRSAAATSWIESPAAVRRWLRVLPASGVAPPACGARQIR
jgi:trehalose 6-phosphate phosphatase